MLYPTLRRRTAPSRRVGETHDFNQVFHRFFSDNLLDEPVITPAVDVRETDDDFAITVDLPGFDSSQVEVSIDNDVLTVSGSRAEEKGVREGKYHLSERRRGEFRRAFVLPDQVDPDSVEGKFANGVLELTFPKRPQSKPKKVKVKVRA